MTKFLSHDFKKICSEPRGTGLDALILQSVIDNRVKLRSLMADGNHEWIANIVDLNALMLALEQLCDYYGGGSVSEEQWILAGYYAYEHLMKLDQELAEV